MRWRPLLLSVLAVCTAACSDSDSNQPTPTTAPTAPTTPMGLRGKLLTATDLPDGFRSVSVDERDPTVPPTGAPNAEFCAEIDQHRTGFPGERVAEADFRRDKGNAAMFVNEEITQYANTKDATLAFNAFTKALGSCATVTKKDADSSIAGSFKPIEFPKLGDDLLANSFNATQTVDDDSANISGYFVAVRVACYVVLFSALGSVDSLSKDDVEDIAKRVVARV